MLSPSYSVPSATIHSFLNGIIVQLYSEARGAPGTQFKAPVFSDPASISKILSEPAQFSKSRYMGLTGALGESRFSANGHDWEVRRNLTQNAYLVAGSSNNASNISAIYRARFASCDPTPEGVHRALMLASSEIFFLALGCNVDTERLLNFFERAREYIRRLQYYSWNQPSASDLSTLREEGDDVLREFAMEMSGSTSMAKLMADFRSRASDLDDFDPRAELLMNFFAGIETTAATLSFAIDRLGVDSRVQQRLYDEVDTGLQNTYINCFIQETMRYFPAIPFVLREAAAELFLNDVRIAKGDKILLSIVGLHHNPSHWNEPEIFDCSRSEFLQRSYNRRAFLPFLAGPRMCGGANLASLELTEGLTAFVRQYTVSGSANEVGFDYGLALRPKTSRETTILRRHR